MNPTCALLLTLTTAGAAVAQPVATPTPPAEATLAAIKDEKTLADALSQIVNDPAIPTKDPRTREVAQALMSEGVRQLLASHFDQALANFLEAYGQFPSPKILLNIGSTLRDMGKPAEAANTYQRYLLDPATGPERVAEVKQLLISLDEQLTILTIRVAPRLAEISIDGGPFVAVGSTLITRTRPGTHLVRIRRDEQNADINVNGFPGETKEVLAALKVKGPDPVLTPLDPTTKPPPKVDDVHQGWMEGDYHYTRSAENPNARGYKRTAEADPLPPLLLTPHDDAEPPDLSAQFPTTVAIDSGAIAVMRIDGKGRGFAGGVGIAIARDRFEGEVMLLRSDVTGGYLGGRYRFLTGFLRPYGALGVPFFVFDNAPTGTMSDTKVSIGVRVAGGVELMLNGHLSVQADLGVEHFFFVGGTRYEANAFVPTLGVIGRL